MKKIQIVKGMKYRATAFFAVLLLGAALLAGCGKKQEQPAETETPGQSSSVSASEQAEANETGSLTHEEESLKVQNDGQHSFLTGEKMDPGEVNRRPLAVMLNNIIEGTPPDRHFPGLHHIRSPRGGPYYQINGYF